MHPIDRIKVPDFRVAGPGEDSGETGTIPKGIINAANARASKGLNSAQPPLCTRYE